jgi:hypothetical protein
MRSPAPDVRRHSARTPCRHDRCAVNRKERLRVALPGADDDLINRLAALPAGAVTDVVTAAKQAHRDGRAREVAVRRQRREDRRKYGHVEDDVQAAAAERMFTARGRRAGTDVGALAAMVDFLDNHTDAILAMAAGQLISQGYSWADIGRALGVRRQTAWKRFGRQPRADTGPAETEGTA